eukprot:jgi/Mesvir1/24829/Mv22069-RA.1
MATSVAGTHALRYKGKRKRRAPLPTLNDFASQITALGTVIRGELHAGASVVEANVESHVAYILDRFCFGKPMPVKLVDNWRGRGGPNWGGGDGRGGRGGGGGRGRGNGRPQQGQPPAHNAQQSQPDGVGPATTNPEAGVRMSEGGAAGVDANGIVVGAVVDGAARWELSNAGGATEGSTATITGDQSRPAGTDIHAATSGAGDRSTMPPVDSCTVATTHVAGGATVTGCATHVTGAGAAAAEGAAPEGTASVPALEGAQGGEARVVPVFTCWPSDIDREGNRERSQHGQQPAGGGGGRGGFEEAFFLLFVMECLRIVQETAAGYTERSIGDSWRLLCAARPGFPSSYAAYHHLRAGAWFPRSGVQFGVDYVIYKDHPSHVHSDYCVIVVPEGTWPTADQQPLCNADLKWEALQGLTRLCGAVSKELLVLYVVLEEGKGDILSDPWALLSRARVQAMQTARWDPNQYRDVAAGDEAENADAPP